MMVVVMVKQGLWLPDEDKQNGGLIVSWGNVFMQELNNLCNKFKRIVTIYEET